AAIHTHAMFSTKTVAVPWLPACRERAYFSLTEKSPPPGSGWLLAGSLPGSRLPQELADYSRPRRPRGSGRGAALVASRVGSSTLASSARSGAAQVHRACPGSGPQSDEPGALAAFGERGPSSAEPPVRLPEGGHQGADKSP